MQGPALDIPDKNRNGVEVFFDFSEDPNLRVEHVQFFVTVDHDYRGDLRYELVSPSGQKSVVRPRPYDRGRRLVEWPFLTVHHWGESSRGVWRLRVTDVFGGDTGQLKAVELVIHGARRTKT
jgi:subtilisin-like proprotein convertase family protein